MSEYDYENIPAGYYDHVYKKGKGVQAAWHRIKFDHVIKHIKSNGSHVDIGCGPGTFIGNYLNKRSEVIGFDLSRSQIEYAKKTYPECSFDVVDGTIPLKNSSIDSVSLIEVIEHLNPIQISHLLNESSRILKTGGQFVITTPNYKSLWPIIEFCLNKVATVSYEEQHISKFTIKTISKLLEESGFKVCEVSTSNLFAPFAAALGNEFSNLVLKFEDVFLSAIPGSIICIVAEKK